MKTVRRPVEADVSYDALKIAQACREYAELKNLWDRPEAEHLKLREDIIVQGYEQSSCDAAIRMGCA